MKGIFKNGDYRTKCIELLESRGATVAEHHRMCSFFTSRLPVDLKKEELLESVMSDYQNASSTRLSDWY